MLPENVDAFRNKFESVVAATIEEHLLIPEIVIDSEISFTDIKMPFYKLVSQMEPFGPQNLRPVFIAKRVTDTGFSKIVKELHLRVVLKQNDVTLTGIGFNMAEKYALIETKQPLDVVFSIDENEWNGETNVQLKLIDLKLSE
jgi:single-stranded-DNA-specific exonuclease